MRGKEGGEGVRWGGVFLCRCRAISSIIARAIVAFTRFGCGAVMLYAIYSDSTTSDYTCKANDKRNDFFAMFFAFRALLILEPLPLSCYTTLLEPS